MNKLHWSDLYLNELSSSLVEELVTMSFQLVASKLSKKEKSALDLLTES